MLVALAVTLVMMAAVVNLFANISGSIRNRRALIEVNSQLRQVRARLALDLAGATCDAKTWQRPGENRGYIEIIEGDRSDASPSELLFDNNSDNRPDGIDFATSLIPSGGSPSVRTPNTAGLDWWEGDVTNAGALGDWDDVLALTVRSESEPFKGRVPYLNPTTNNWETRTEDANLAEVIWAATETPIGGPGEPGMRQIYRRALLIRPNAQLPPLNTLSGTDNQAKLRDFLTKYDVSVRVQGGQLIPNTLGDLTKREFRFARAIDSIFPHTIFQPFFGTIVDNQFLVLSSALAFDVRVYEPGAPLFDVAAGTVVQPGDPGWFDAVTATGTPVPVGYGAYCDLGWNWNTTTNTLIYTPAAAALPIYFGVPLHPGWHPRYINTSWGGPSTYDTWSFHYENDGINQDQGQVDSLVTNPAGWRDTLDQGTNGLDDDNANGVDDPGERETSPPYNVPLRGVKISLRIYETDARQIRETSVTHSFAK